MKRYALVTSVLALGCLAGTPAPAGAQVWKKVKERVSERVGTRKQQADSVIVETATGTVDSTLATGSRAVETGVTKVGAAADAAIDGTERGVKNTFTARGGRSTADRITADLASTGRATLRGLDFAPRSAELQPTSDPVLQALAKVLNANDAAFLIEGHVEVSGDPAADQGLSEQRAKAVKTRLVALGVPTARLFATGYGSSRPAAGDSPRQAPADSAKKGGGTATMAKSVAEAVVPGAKLIGLGAKAMKAKREQQSQADSAKALAAANARIVIAKVQ